MYINQWPFSTENKADRKRVDMGEGGDLLPLPLIAYYSCTDIEMYNISFCISLFYYSVK